MNVDSVLTWISVTDRSSRNHIFEFGFAVLITNHQTALLQIRKGFILIVCFLTDRKPTMASVMFYILFLLCTYVGAVSHNEQQIMEAMAEKFLSADTDFVEIKKNAEFFPLTNAMEFNRLPPSKSS